jgi:protein deglycase
VATALICLADGFEEIEAMAVVDVLRRGKVQVVLGGVSGKTVKSARGVSVNSDCLLNDCLETLYDCLILPGGEPGTTHLGQSEAVSHLIQTHAKNQKWVAAICAAPRVLHAAGVIADHTVTSYPSIKETLLNCDYSDSDVVVSEQIITSRGPGTAIHFALAILEKIASPSIAQVVQEAMLVQI